MVWQSGMRITPARLNAPTGLVVAKIESAVAQSITQNTDTPVNFTVATLDLVTGWDPINPSRWRPLLAGWYWFGGGGSLEGVAGTQMQAFLRKNGSSNIGGSHGSTDSAVANPSAPIKNTAEAMNGTTDYVELMVRHNAAAAVNTATTAARRPILAVIYGGPLT